MFKPSVDLQVKIDAIFVACLRFDRGDTIPRELFSEILCLQPYEGQWYHCVASVLKRIEDERGIASWSAHRIGYRLLTEDQQINDLPRLRQKKARRQVRKGLDSVEALPIEGLTENQLRVRSVRIEQMRKIQHDIAAEARLMRVLLQPAEAP